MKVLKTPDQTIPGINTVQYSAADAVGTSSSFPVPDQGIIESVAVTDLADQSGAFDILLFDTDITSGTNNAAFDMADADAANFIGSIAIVAGDYQTLNDNAVGTQRNIGMAYQCRGGTMYYQCVARGTPTYAAAGDLVFSLTISHGR